MRAHWNRLARTYDRREALIERWIAPLRKRLWSRVRGRVLEVGAGTGKNFRFHPPGSDVVAMDLSDQMLVYARRRTDEVGSHVEILEGDVEHLEFPSSSFDTAVATFVFCSVPDPRRGLQEMSRVVRPGGTILLLEHVRIDRPLVGALMDLIDPLILRMNGAHVNRRSVDTVMRAGLRIIQMEEFGPMGLIKLIEATPNGLHP